MNKLTPTPIGILGMGFLGKILALKFVEVTGSWGTWHDQHISRTGKFNIFNFDWQDKNTWNNLPEDPVNLILTIPPLIDNPDTIEESERLRKWGVWMLKNRPLQRRLIYISSTGVYPKQNGVWCEKSKFEPDRITAKLRMMTEKILSQYFQLHVIRPGGIYGEGRNVAVRLKKGKKIALNSTPVHRIHVEDLANIIEYVVENSDAPTCINAVDLEAKPTWEVARWLAENGNEIRENMLPKLPDSFFTIPGTPERYISNERLLSLKIPFQYPTFREGMA